MTLLNHLKCSDQPYQPQTPFPAMHNHHQPDQMFPRLDRFKIELPSWGFADTGTRFGKFTQDAAALTIEDKLDDAAEVNNLTDCCPTVAIHVLWDIPDADNPTSLKTQAEQRGLTIGSINPNLFQDQIYKLGSLTNTDPNIRRRAIEHLLDSVRLAESLDSKIISLWLADGSNYPGQANIRQRKHWLQEALAEVHAALPPEITLLIEYKPFEPAFYHTDIADWGVASLLAKSAGPQAKVLVDTGHHLLGTNIEQIVALLIDENLLGGFHFNDRKYADDDLTIGSIDPYQIFRIFYEITQAEWEFGSDLDIAYMIDQSHNLKPKTAAMIQSVMRAQELFAKALLVDHKKIAIANKQGDIVASERILQDAFATDTRPILQEWRTHHNLPADPLDAHRQSGYDTQCATDRKGRKPSADTSYA